MRVFFLVLIVLLFLSYLTLGKKSKKVKNVPKIEKEEEDDEILDSKIEEKPISQVLDLKRCNKEDFECLEYEFFTLSSQMELNKTIDVKIKKMNKWIKKYYPDHNLYVDKIDSKISKYGLFSTKNINIGDVLLNVREDKYQFLHENSIMTTYFKDTYLIYFQTVLPNLLESMDKTHKMVLGLLYHTAYSFDSHYEDWIYLLPNKIDALFITINPEELELLKEEKEVYSLIKKLRSEFIEGYYTLVDVLQRSWMNKHPQMVKDFFRRNNLTMSDYIWARYIIETRKIFVKNELNNDDFIVPFLMDYMKPDIFTETIEDSMIEIPLMLNNNLTIHSDREILSNNRIVSNHYLKGKTKKNLHFLVYHGFVPEINHHECLNINIIPRDVALKMPRQIFSFLVELGYPGFNICINEQTKNLENKLRFMAFFINLEPDTMVDFHDKYKEIMQNSNLDKFETAFNLLKKPETLKIDYRINALQSIEDITTKYNLNIQKLDLHITQNGKNQNTQIIFDYFNFYMKLCNSMKQIVINSLKDYEKNEQKIDL